MTICIGCRGEQRGGDRELTREWRVTSNLVRPRRRYAGSQSETSTERANLKMAAMESAVPSDQRRPQL